MARHTKPGRNDLCPCGSGKKFKQCCETKTARSAWAGRVLMVLVGAAILGGVAAGVMSFGEKSSAGPLPGTVWSPEHGHYH